MRPHVREERTLPLFYPAVYICSELAYETRKVHSLTHWLTNSHKLRGTSQYLTLLNHIGYA